MSFPTTCLSTKAMSPIASSSTASSPSRASARSCISPDRSWFRKASRQPLEYYRNNTLASHALLSAAVDAGVKHFVFSSTAAVYGAPEQVPVDEGAPKLPINPYGASKLMTERMLEDSVGGLSAQLCGASLFQRIGCRSAGPLGPGRQGLDPSDQGRRRGRRRQARPCRRVRHRLSDTPDGSCVRDYIHVSDLADAAREGARTADREAGGKSGPQSRLRPRPVGARSAGRARPGAAGTDPPRDQGPARRRSADAHLVQRSAAQRRSTGPRDTPTSTPSSTSCARMGTQAGSEKLAVKRAGLPLIALAALLIGAAPAEPLRHVSLQTGSARMSNSLQATFSKDATPGSRGHEIAANYVASEFRELGLTPGGRGWKLVRPSAIPQGDLDGTPQDLADSLAERTTAAGRWDRMSPSARASMSSKLDLSAPLVFVGYGISDQRLGIDDYAGLDVRGKIVVGLGDPVPRSAQRDRRSSDLDPGADVAGAHGCCRLHSDRRPGDRCRATCSGSASGQSSTGSAKDRASIKARVALSVSELRTDFPEARRCRCSGSVRWPRPASPIKGFDLPARLSVSVEQRLGGLLQSRGRRRSCPAPIRSWLPSMSS